MCAQCKDTPLNVFISPPCLLPYHTRLYMFWSLKKLGFDQQLPAAKLNKQTLQDSSAFVCNLLVNVEAARHVSYSFPRGSERALIHGGVGVRTLSQWSKFWSWLKDKEGVFHLTVDATAGTSPLDWFRCIPVVDQFFAHVCFRVAMMDS